MLKPALDPSRGQKRPLDTCISTSLSQFSEDPGHHEVHSDSSRAYTLGCSIGGHPRHTTIRDLDKTCAGCPPTVFVCPKERTLTRIREWMLCIRHLPGPPLHKQCVPFSEGHELLKLDRHHCPFQ